MKKKILSALCAICLCILNLPALSGVAVFAEERINDEFLTATADLSTITTNYTRIGIPSLSGKMTDAATKGGRTGITSDIASGKYYLPFSVYSSYLYNLTEYTPVEVTVDYYDEGTGFFALYYDKLGADNGAYDTLYVELEDSGTWKSFTFYFDNCRFADKLGGTSDFILTVKDSKKGTSSCDVVFGAVTVTKVKFNSLVRHDYITSANPGNIFGISDSIAFTQDIENKTSENVVSKYSWDIIDEEGKSVASYSKTENLSANRTKTRNISIHNPRKYGVYKIYVTEENYVDGSPENKYEETYTEEFSVCMSLNSSNIDDNFGFNQPIVRGYGEPSISGPLLLKSGARWNRESLMWSAVESSTEMDAEAGPNRGVLNISTNSKNRLNALRSQGINIVVVLTGRHPLHGERTIKGEKVSSNPYTDDDIAAYARFCAYAAETFAPLGVTHFEIWNEWNVTNFNPTGESPETYAKLLKAAYTAITEVNPEAVVLGCGSANPKQRTWMSRVLTALGGETCMDALSVHCYDYTDTDAFVESQFIGNIQYLKNLLGTYSLGSLPIWITEAGFSTYDNSTKGFVAGCTKDVQLNSMVLMGAVNKAYGLSDKLIQYCLHDYADPTYIEANWGVLNCWSREYNLAENKIGRKLLAYGAKPSYLGLAAMNYFTGGNATYMNMLKEGRSYAFEFNNSNLGKKVILAINGGFNNNITKEFHLGCTSIDIYDKYGNLADEMNSATGEYSIDTYSEPIYIVGDFTNFDVVDPYIRLSASLDLEDNTVTITGNTREPNDLVSVMVVTDGAELVSYDAGRVKYIAQTVSDSYGDFSVQYVTDTLSGTYKIYANSERRRSKMVEDLVFTYTVPELTVTKNNTSITSMSQLSAGNRPVIKLSGIESAAERLPKMIVAQYDDDELIDFKASTAAGDFTTLGHEFSTDFTVAEGADKIKILYWNMESNSPIIASYEIN